MAISNVTAASEISTVKGDFHKFEIEKPKEIKKKRFLLALSGVLIGVVSGIFGAGGGMLAVPALSFFGGLDAKKSHATAIAVILPLCALASIVYAVRETFDFSVVMPTVLGVVIGGVFGAVLLKKLPSGVLSFLFYGLMLFAGLRMIVG